MLVLSRALAVAALFSCVPVAAQPSAPATQIILRQGTAVTFKTDQALSSKTARVGDRFELRSIEDVRIGTQVIIPAGTRAVGEVTFVEKKGAFGRSGKLDTRVLYAVLGDQHIGMAGRSHDQGAGGTAGTVAAAVLFWPVMPFVTGKSADFPTGTKMDGFIENDIPVGVTQAAPVAALIVPATVVLHP